MEIRARILFNFFHLCNIWRCVIFTMLAIVLHFNSHFRCYVSIKLNSDAKKHEQIRKNENSLSSFYGVIFFIFCAPRKSAFFLYDLHTVLWEITLKPVSISFNSNKWSKPFGFFFHCIHNLWDKITSTLFIMYQNTQPCMRARLVVQCIRLLVDATIIASYSRSKLQILSTSNTIHVQLLYFNLTIYLSVDFEVFFKLFTLIPEH